MAAWEHKASGSCSSGEVKQHSPFGAPGAAGLGGAAAGPGAAHPLRNSPPPRRFPPSRRLPATDDPQGNTNLLTSGIILHVKTTLQHSKTVFKTLPASIQIQCQETLQLLRHGKQLL